jgi:hypothetical protein
MSKSFYTSFFTVVTVCALVGSFVSCKKNPASPVIPTDDRPLISASDYGKIRLNMVGYDLVEITHQFGLQLRSSTVRAIAIGSKDNAGFQQYSFVPDTFDSQANSFIIRFDFKVLMDRSQTIAPLTIRYYSSDSSYVDVDTSVALYKYPFANAQIVADSSVAIHSQPFQDVARLGSVLYFHPIGPLGLYAVDLNTRSVSDLFDYGSGDHIAADSQYVFCDDDMNGFDIDRYNIIKGSVDLTFHFNFNRGMATYNGFLYAVDGTSHQLIRFTLALVPLDSIEYPTNSYYLAIHDSIAYGVDETTVTDSSSISRFDLRTRQFLPSIHAPAFSCNGIKFFGDTLYFCDYWKRTVGAVLLSDLISGMPTHTE